MRKRCVGSDGSGDRVDEAVLLINPWAILSLVPAAHESGMDDPVSLDGSMNVLPISLRIRMSDGQSWREHATAAVAKTNTGWFVVERPEVAEASVMTYAMLAHAADLLGWGCVLARRGRSRGRDRDASPSIGAFHVSAASTAAGSDPRSIHVPDSIARMDPSANGVDTSVNPPAGAAA